MSTTTAQHLSSERSTTGPFRLAIAMLVVTTFTILLGAMTTSTGSGMAYADWPLSDGQVMPESSYTTVPGFLEHFHRLFASSTGLLALGLWLWLQFGYGAQKTTRLFSTPVPPTIPCSRVSAPPRNAVPRTNLVVFWAP